MRPTLTSILLVFSILVCSNIDGQIGREFWFAVPSVIEGHGDAPVAFRITALDNAATVTLSQPANPEFSRTLNLAANEQQKIEFSSRSDVNQLENFPADQVNNKGVLITSDQDITVYYEVAHPNNPDKFTLKGDNALGNAFYISSQTTYINYGIEPNKIEYTWEPPYEQVDIVATQDGTVVDITPTMDVEGHEANVTYSITLNRGQTYCVKGTSREADYNLAGTYIQSNKPIAVTISDDSIFEQNWERDLVGDQTIPLTVIGNEYIAMFSGEPKKRRSIAPVNKVYVLAVEDNTTVTVDVNQTTSGSFQLQKGEQRELDIEEEGALHIVSDNNVYVYQLSGLVFDSSKGNELGSAILPPIKCTGSSSVSFTRILTDQFFVQILTQYKNISFFELVDENGISVNTLNGLTWHRVPGTGVENDDETWYFANSNMNTLDTGDPYVLTNSKGLFHLSVFDQNSTSASFGYYSAFNSLRIDGPTQECNGNEIRLSASDNLGTYNWFSDQTGNTVLSTDPYLDVTKSGLYWVEATRMLNSTEGCESVDSVRVEFNMPEFSLGSDATVCQNEPYLVTPNIISGTHEWYDGSSGQTYEFTATSDGTTAVWLEITDAEGCVGRDTIEITALPPVVIDINLDVTVNNNVCYGHIIQNRTNLDSYEWRYASLSSPILGTDASIQVFNSGWYYLTATKDGCSSTDSVQVTIQPLPTISLNDDLLCSDAIYTSPINNSGYNYQWQTVQTGLISSASEISFNQTDSVYVQVTDPASGCASKDSAFIEFREAEEIRVIDMNVCGYSDQQLMAGSNIQGPYSWTFEGTALSEASNTLNLTKIQSAHEGQYIVNGLTADGCNISQIFNLTLDFGKAVAIGNDKYLCENEEVQLTIGNHASNNVEWYLNENPGLNPVATIISTRNKIDVSTQGTYYVKTQHGSGCFSVDSVDVYVQSRPNINLSIAAGAECQGETEIFDAGAGYVSYLWQDGSANQAYLADHPQEVSVVVTDANGCVGGDTISYEWNPVTIFMDEDVVVCPGVNQTLSVSNTLSNIEWFFDNGTTRIDLGNSTNNYTVNSVGAADAGDYIVRANENGCLVEDTIALYLIDVGNINLGRDRSVCEGEIIELNANTGFDSYQWKLESDLSTIVSTSSSIQAGTDAGANPEVWILEVSENDNGCVLRDTISIEKMPFPTFDLQDNIEPCPGILLVQDVITALNSNSNIDAADQVNYYWGNDLINNVDINNMTIEESGAFEVQVANRYQDTNGDIFECYASDVVNVNFHDEFEVPYLPDVFLCSGEIATLSTPASVPAYADFQSYQWSRLNPDNSVAETNAPNSDWVGVATEGNYVLSVNYTADACIATDTLTIETKLAPLVNISGDNEICQGNETIIAATAGYSSYSWNTGSTTDTIHVTSSGIYDVAVTGPNGCIANESYTVTVNELPQLSLNNSAINKCEGQNATIEVISANYSNGSAVNSPSYFWNTWETSSAISVSEEGVFDVQVEDTKGCVGTTSASVTNFNKPTIDLSGIQTTACYSVGVDLVCPLVVGVDILDFQWTKKLGDSSSFPDVNNNWNVTEPGVYVLTITDNNFCQSQDSVEVSILAGPSIELGPDENKCVGDSLFILSPEQYTSYQWSTGATTSAITVQASASPVTYGIEVWDSNGCSSQDVVIIQPIDNPGITLTDPPAICFGQQTTLTPTIVSPSGSYSVWWSCNKDEEVIEVGPGNYTITVTDDVNGCVAEASASVTSSPMPKVSLGKDQYLCPTLTDFPIHPEQGDVFAAYLWHNSANTYQINGDIGEINNVVVSDVNGCKSFDQVVIQYMVYEDSVYQFAMCQQDTTISLIDIDPEASMHSGEYLWLHDSTANEFNTFSSSDTIAVDVGITLDGTNTCYYKRDSLIFDFYPLPNITTLDTMIYSQIRVGVETNNVPYYYSLDSLYWQEENVFDKLESGSYTVYVRDNNECVISEMVSIFAEVDINVPAFFTPNNDGYNDTWEIEGVERMPESKIRIYDRYGKLIAIYSATSPGWNGMYLDKPMPVNDYWYVIELLPVQKYLKGHFTLKR